MSIRSDVLELGRRVADVIDDENVDHPVIARIAVEERAHNAVVRAESRSAAVAIARVVRRGVKARRP